MIATKKIEKKAITAATLMNHKVVEKSEIRRGAPHLFKYDNITSNPNAYPPGKPIFNAILTASDTSESASRSNLCVINFEDAGSFPMRVHRNCFLGMFFVEKI